MPAKITVPEIGQWYFILTLSPIWWEHRPEKGIFQFGFFKVLERPPEGEMYQRYHYQGFWIRNTFNWPAFGISHNFKLLTLNKSVWEVEAKKLGTNCIRIMRDLQNIVFKKKNEKK